MDWNRKVVAQYAMLILELGSRCRVSSCSPKRIFRAPAVVFNSTQPRQAQPIPPVDLEALVEGHVDGLERRSCDVANCIFFFFFWKSVRGRRPRCIVAGIVELGSAARHCHILVFTDGHGLLVHQASFSIWYV